MIERGIGLFLFRKLITMGSLTGSNHSAEKLNQANPMRQVKTSFVIKSENTYMRKEMNKSCPGGVALRTSHLHQEREGPGSTPARV
jgi:hypothetical protein